MRLLLDSSGITYELIEAGKGRVRLQNKRFPEISHTYKKEFIDSAIQNGMLNPFIPEPPKPVQQKLQMMGG